MKNKAFTLIELLVVISIIALLVALLLPALGKARQSGESMQCKSNQRNVATVVQNYVNDEDSFLPPMWDAQGTVGGIGGAASYKTWRGYLARYVNTTPSVFDCPSEEINVYADPTTPGDSQYYGEYGEGRIGSGLGAVNIHWAIVTGAPTPPFGRGAGARNKLDDIESTGRAIMFGDGNSARDESSEPWPYYSWWIWADGAWEGNVGGWDRTLNEQFGVSYGEDRHNGSANYAYVDGHVKTAAPNEIPCTSFECEWSAEVDPHP